MSNPHLTRRYTHRMKRQGSGIVAPSTLRNFLFTLLIALVGVVIHLQAANRPSGIMTTGQLRDTDAYTRTMRVERLHTGSWYETDLPQLNAPEGLSLHWTRPLDVLILLPALAAKHIAKIPSRTAIFWVGAWISPLLHIASALAAAWAARACWRGSEAWIASLVVLSHPVLLLGYGSVGFTDHHLLLLFMEVLSMGATLRAILIPDEPRWGLISGAMFGAGLWISPEMLLISAPALGTFGVSWWLLEESRAVARQGMRISFAMLAVIVVAVVVERPPAEWQIGEYDKVSIQHAVIAFLAGTVFSICSVVPSGADRWRRFLVGSVSAFGAIACLFAIYPHALSSSQAAADASATKLFLPFVKEMQAIPLNLSGLPDLLLYATGLILFPVVLMLFRDHRWPAGLVAGAVLASTCVATLLHRRFSADLMAIAGPLCAGLASMAIARSNSWPRILRVLSPGMVIILVLAAPYVSAAYIKKERQETAACDWSGLAQWLQEGPLQDPRGGNVPAIIFTDTPNSTPLLAYRTPYHFVASPYHRAGLAFQDQFDAMTTLDDKEALRILQRRKAAFILLCTKQRPPTLGPKNPRALEARLRAEENPEWLEPVPLPAPFDETFRLLRLR